MSQCPFRTVAQFIPKKGEPKEIDFIYPPKLKTLQLPFYNHVLIDFDYIGTHVTPEKIVHYFKETNYG